MANSPGKIGRVLGSNPRLANAPQIARRLVKANSFTTSAPRLGGSNFHRIPSAGCATHEAHTAP
jgi:hypothetical protein